MYLMPDYGGGPLWWEGGGEVQLDPTPTPMYWDDVGVVLVEPIPLREDTKKALKDWSGQMFRALDAHLGEGPPFDDQAFNAEGDRLLRQMRAELHGVYEVGRARLNAGKKWIEWEPDSA